MAEYATHEELRRSLEESERQNNKLREALVKSANSRRATEAQLAAKTAELSEEKQKSLRWQQRYLDCRRESTPCKTQIVELSAKAARLEAINKTNSQVITMLRARVAALEKMLTDK